MLAADAGPSRKRKAFAAEPFVGRKRELEHIATCIGQARAGGSRLIAVSGEIGSGKTELLQRCVPLLTDFTILSASCRSTENVAESADLISQLMGRLSIESAGDPPIPGYLNRLGRQSPEMCVELLHAILDATRRGPVALLIDDLHQADTESLQALSFILRRTADRPMLTLVAMRTGRSERHSGNDQSLPMIPWQRVVAFPQPHTKVPLAGLNDIELSQLAQRILHTPARPGAVEQLHRYTAGNPLRARKLLSELGPDGPGLNGPLRPPRRMFDEFRLRLAALPRQSRDLLDAMAVLNTRCRLALPAQVSGVPDAVAALEPLLQTDLVQWWSAEPSSPVCICDPITRDVIYGLIGPQRRRDLHRVAASIVERTASWAHRVAAATGPDPDLANELHAEAHTAVADHDEEYAATLLLWAADLSSTRASHERHLLTGALHLLRCEVAQHRAAHIMSSVDACGPSALRHCVQGEYALREAAIDRAQVHLTKSMRLAMESGQTGVVAHAAGSLAGTFLLQGLDRQATRYADVALAQHDIDPATASRARSCRTLGIMYSQGPGEALRRLADDSRHDIGAGPADPALVACRAVCRLLAGNLTAAMDDAFAANQTRRSSAIRVVLVFAQYLLGFWDDALSVVYDAAPSLTSGSTSWQLLPWHAAVSMLASGRGDFDTAEQELASMRHLRVPGSSEQLVLTGLAEASLAQARGNHLDMVAACEPLTGRTIDHPNRDHILAWQAIWRPLHIEGLIGSGQLDAAGRAMAELAVSSRDVPHLHTTLVRLAGLLAQARGAVRKARDLYARALAKPLGRNEIPFQRAHLELAYGRLLVSVGDRRQAINWLRRAERRYTELSAQPFLDRCAADLAHAGLRRTLSHSEAERRPLTERERQVSELVVDGMTNHEVATRLYVSQKTVEYHLRNIYAKLGISSRRELRARRGRDELTG